MQIERTFEPFFYAFYAFDTSPPLSSLALREASFVCFGLNQDGASLFFSHEPLTQHFGRRFDSFQQIRSRTALDKSFEIARWLNHATNMPSCARIGSLFSVTACFYRTWQTPESHSRYKYLQCWQITETERHGHGWWISRTKKCIFSVTSSEGRKESSFRRDTPS